MTDPESTTLANARSPFLRHGAQQPVEWMPWGSAAFRRARELDRPVLLDIGAVWCHWCHVMDRESYEDPDTAALINERYVPVKVDRDDRPDVDARYQRAVQLLVGQGGWPLTGFLTPDGELFHGGTYFPPDERYGRPSFRRVLTEISRVWAEDRARAKEAAGAVRERLSQVLEGEASPGEVDPRLVDDAIEALAGVYDEAHGGFGGAPKFPNAGALLLLLDRWLAEGSERARTMATDTLVAMAAGGIRDHLGGGFHRYATDARWIIPHFEKMAYDNGALLEVFARAGQALDSDPLRQAAAGIVAYYRDVAPELVEAGGFPASQDADIDADDDGDYWTWTESEIREALDPDSAEAALLHWGVGDPASSMHLDPSRSVLFLSISADDVARRLDRSRDGVRRDLDRARQTLKSVRDGRPRPFVDETLYTGWVALVASGHLAAARHLDMPEAGQAAVRALDGLWSGVPSDPAGGDGLGLPHRVGDPGSGRYLADQAYAARAAIDAFEWTQDDRWLDRARALAGVIRQRFADPSGALLDVPADGHAAVDLLRERRLEITDAPEPSPNAVAAMVFLRLAAIDDDPALGDQARRLLAAFAGSAPRFAASAATYFRALRWATRPLTTVVVVEERPDGGPGPLLRTALRVHRPETLVRGFAPDEVEPGRVPESVRSMLSRDAPRAYVCAGQTCAAPVREAAALEDLLRSFRG